MMESELSLRGRVGIVQMLPLLLLLTSVNAQFLPVRDYQNNGQDEYLDYLDYRGEQKLAQAPVPAPNIRGEGNARVEAQLGGRAPNLNIRGAEAGNNPCLLDPTGCYLEIQRLRAALNQQPRAAFQRQQPSLSADPCLLDPTGCYGNLEQVSGKGTKKPGLISKPGGARSTLPPHLRTTLAPRNKQTNLTLAGKNPGLISKPGGARSTLPQRNRQAAGIKKTGLISKPGGARTTLAPTRRFETAKKPGLISKPGTKTPTALQPLRPPPVNRTPTIRRFL